jgi:hypothetical protein
MEVDPGSEMMESPVGAAWVGLVADATAAQDWIGTTAMCGVDASTVAPRPSGTRAPA